ncbi:hypothetical protein NKJ90_30815 [Mesorhizobium sp. M0051]
MSGLMILFAARTGMVEAIHLDNGYLTDIRTAAAGAVAAKWLSRPESRVAGILGTGTQARLQLEALALVRDIHEAVIWGRDPKNARQCADDCQQKLGIDVRTGTIDDVMAAADIVVTTTPSQIPLIHGAQLRRGQHVTAMGTDAVYKTEIAPDVIPAASRFICDSLAQCRRQGELRPAIAARTVATDGQLAVVGTRISRVSCTRRQSRPSRSACNCAAVSRTTPSVMPGQQNLPSSSRLANKHTPVPSK